MTVLSLDLAKVPRNVNNYKQPVNNVKRYNVSATVRGEHVKITETGSKIQLLLFVR
jgi:hypothetical protein